MFFTPATTTNQANGPLLIFYRPTSATLADKATIYKCYLTILSQLHTCKMLVLHLTRCWEYQMDRMVPQKYKHQATAVAPATILCLQHHILPWWHKSRFHTHNLVYYRKGDPPLHLLCFLWVYWTNSCIMCVIPDSTPKSKAVGCLTQQRWRSAAPAPFHKDVSLARWLPTQPAQRQKQLLPPIVPE